MRRKRFRKSNYSNTGVNILGIVAIVLAAIVAGFLLTEFIVYPVMLGVAGPVSDQKEEKNAGSDTGTTVPDTGQKTPVATDQKTQADNAAKAPPPSTGTQVQQSGYCIQFGSFSTKAAADTLLAQLTTSGIKASVMEKDGNFKVVGELFSDKATAAAAMAAVDRTIYTDVFVTNI